MPSPEADLMEADLMNVPLMVAFERFADDQQGKRRNTSRAPAYLINIASHP